MIRGAEPGDIDGVVQIYAHILDSGESIGWVKGIYPTRRTALEALEKDELFVDEEDGQVVAAARINRVQVPEYALADWNYQAPEAEVMVLHTLVVEPAQAGKGLGRRFVQFSEDYALENGCRYLRMDTNAVNARARSLYKRLGYTEAGIVPCNFNGIAGVQLVCLEKTL